MVLTLGLEEGNANNQVSATMDGLVGLGPLFTASAVLPGDERDTRFVGVVLDTENEPLPGVTVSILRADPPVETTTNDEGEFALSGVPVGPGYLFVDPRTTTRPGLCL